MTAPLDVRPTSALLKALADDTRLRIVALLSRGELCVGASGATAPCA